MPEKADFYWPPGFLEEDHLLDSPAAAPKPGAAAEGGTSELTEDLHRRLAHAFRVIDRQGARINDLTGLLEQQRLDWEEERENHRKAALRADRRRRLAFLICTVLAVGAALLGAGREISQVGWNVLCWITDILGVTPEGAVGLAVAGVVVWLTYRVLVWMVRALLDDLCGGEEAEPDDLGDR